MKLTVSLSYTQRAAEAINDNRYLFGLLERTNSNVWASDDETAADEVEYALVAAGIPEDEFTIE